jgi:hypothetical protein
LFFNILKAETAAVRKARFDKHEASIALIGAFSLGFYAMKQTAVNKH